MPALDILSPFAIATALFAYMPGPAMLYTAAQTMARGRGAGFMAAAGIHVGGYAHVIAAALGLSAIFRHVPEAYMAVKVAGALYLVWLGIGILRRRPEASEVPILKAKTARRAFLESIAVEVLNPKAALFFIAFLPQFVDPAAAFPIWAQFLILGTVVNLAFSSADVVVVWLASAVLVRVRRSSVVQRVTRIVGGTILIGLGARLAIARD